MPDSDLEISLVGTDPPPPGQPVRQHSRQHASGIGRRQSSIPSAQPGRDLEFVPCWPV